VAEQPANTTVYKNFVWNSERWDGFELRDDDIVISTAPKCGTTWLQMQVALLLFRTPDLPAPLAALSPWLEMNTRPLADVRAALEAQPHRRFIKSHTPLDGLPWHDGVTYLHVGRDPRDVALSWDNHVSNMDYERFVEIRAAAVGLDDLEELGIADEPIAEAPEDPAQRFWAWVEGAGAGTRASGLQGLVHHSQTFWATRQRPNVHLFHYSDQRADLATQMARLADALGVDPPTEALVEAARFENMKARADHLVPNADLPYWQSNQRFFDKARAGEWHHLVGDEGLPRYEAALRQVTDDDELIRWLHAGSLSG
jgi:hypothetical protein